MIRLLRDIPIRRKLMLIILATCFVVLTLGGIALTLRYAATEQERMASRMSVLAEVIGANTTAALSFNDPVSAHDTLAALVAEPSVIGARVYDRQGRLFSRFTAPGNDGDRPPAGGGSVGNLIFGGDTLTVSSPIVLDGETIGRVVLDADLRPLRVALARDVVVLTLIIVAAGLMALPLSSRLQMIVSEPISRLVLTMRKVTRSKDYSLRAQKQGNDEVGTLIDGFNEMLAQISRRDEQLRIAANALENTGDAIVITDEHLRIVSVNKAFTGMTGFSGPEVSGRRPGMLTSERHDAAFHRRIWRQLSGSGQWYGELWGRRRNGEEFPQWLTISAVRDKAGTVTHYVFVSNDISQHKRDEERLEHMAHHDALTQLPNRVLFALELNEALHRANRHGSLLCLMFIDLDNFKTINDSLGHAAGDDLLKTVAVRLKGCLRECDVVARQGGDEFTVLLDGLREARDAARVAEKFIAELARPIHLAGHDLFVTASIGISCYPEDGHEASDLLRNADTAMYLAKEQGRNRYRFHSPGANQKVIEILTLTNSMHLALSRQEFELHYQPRYDLDSQAMTGVEALLRWRHPERGLLAAGEFLPVAEESGVIEEIGEWVLRHACLQAKAWREGLVGGLRVAVNLSMRQFHRPGFVDRIEEMMRETGCDPAQLELEIKEDLMMRDHEHIAAALERLSALGVTITVDNFGTGHSSLGYLKRFPLDALKIDRSFVQGLPDDADDLAIAGSIIALAKSLKLRVIAEGVETEAQRRFLQQAGCLEAQGHLFNRPLPPATVEALRCGGGDRVAGTQA